MNHTSTSRMPSLTINVQHAKRWSTYRKAPIPAVEFCQDCPGKFLHILTPTHGRAAHRIPIQVTLSAYPILPLYASLPSPRPDEARQRRYSQAEQALVATARHTFAEVSPRELQIRTLRQAAALLSSRSEDARSRAAHVRALLNDRNTDPSEFESLKRERWREERRLAAAEDEAKVISDQLAALATTDSDAPAPSISRKQANLLRFLNSHGSVKPKPKHKTIPSLKDDRMRRVTMSAASPMRLRTSIPQSHLRSISLDLNIKLPPRPRAVSASSSSLRTVTEHDDLQSELVLGKVPKRFSSTSVSTLATVAEAEPESPIQFAPTDGTALIHTSYAVNMRPTSRLLANLPASSIPLYALDLIGHFADHEQPVLDLQHSRPSAPRPSQEWEVLRAPTPDDVPETPTVFSAPNGISKRRPISLSFLKRQSSRASLNLTSIPESPTPSRCSSPMKALNRSPSKGLKKRLKFFS
ncbi:hypothetical protein BDZ89DRAFT_1119023 [Hymenopellis radicata]|nr:hypothetical protein BDZ89DRAFT_1119023 [Hymenopellis radicata]